MNTPTSPTAEKKKVRLRPSPWDALVVAAVLLLALALFFGLMQRGGGSGALVCTVSQNAAVLDTITLSDTDPVQQKTYGDYTLEIGHGQVRILSAPCANQDCVRTGRISRAGQSIVCLPGRFVVQLTAAGSGSSDFDIVVK